MKPVTMPLVLAGLLLAAALVGNAQAQNITAPSRISSMAYSGVALVNGVDAIGINPALLTLPKGSVVSLAIVPFSMNAGSDFFSYETYKKYFTGVPSDVTQRDPYHLTNSDKSQILNLFSGQTGTVRIGMAYTLAAGSVTTKIGSFAVGMQDRIATNAVVPRSLAEFFLYGNTPGRLFDFSQTSMSSSWTRDYSVSFAHRFQFTRKQSPALSVGVSVKYVQGFGYFNLDQFNSSFRTDPENFRVTGRAQMHALYAGTEWMAQSDIFKFQLFPTPVGSGFGIDLGMVADMSPSFRLALSFTDVGSITWDRNAKEVIAEAAIDITDLGSYQQLEEIQKQLNGNERAISSFSSALPTAVTAGASYSFYRFLGINRPLHLAIAVREGLNNVPGNSTIPHVGIGAEWEAIESLPIRFGVAAGGGLPPMLAAGIGLKMDSFTVDIGTNSLDSYVSSQHSTLTFAISGRLDF
jgi:hypothetical protein